MKENSEYISVAEYARRVGKSTQTIRNWIRQGRVQTMTWKRGKMLGIICKYDKE